MLITLISDLLDNYVFKFYILFNLCRLNIHPYILYTLYIMYTQKIYIYIYKFQYKFYFISTYY